MCSPATEFTNVQNPLLDKSLVLLLFSRHHQNENCLQKKIHDVTVFFLFFSLTLSPPGRLLMMNINMFTSLQDPLRSCTALCNKNLCRYYKYFFRQYHKYCIFSITFANFRANLTQNLNKSKLNLTLQMT
jgi:hypothetical protein